MDMRRAFTLEYWPDAGGFVGRLREVPGVFSQGDTLAELEENIRDAYSTVLAEEPGEPRREVERKEIEVTLG
jgi:predicted RNase H-like HicB family nuclease